MVARVLRIDGDDRQVREVLAFAERQLRHPVRLGDRLLGELVAKAMLVDGDQAEAARGERIAEHRVNAGAYARRTSGDFAQHEVAGFRVFDVADEQFAPLALVHRRQPEPLALAFDHAEHQLGRALQLLERVGDKSRPLLLRPGEHAVADPERAAPAALDDPELGRRRFRMPLLGHGADLAAVIDIDHAQHRHLGHSAGLMERAAGR